MANKKTNQGNNELEYNTITEEGKEITNPEETKQHIATYFENLHQARLGIWGVDKDDNSNYEKHPTTAYKSRSGIWTNSNPRIEQSNYKI